ncbi:MAG: hypothetical protein WB973_17900 [Thermoanaerobaculia bacterium]
MTKMAILSLLLIAALPVLADDPLPQDQPSPTVRGIPLGASKETVHAAFPKCDLGQVKQIRLCVVMHNPIGSVDASDAYIFDDHGTVSRIGLTFSTTSYPLMRETFMTKFGKPTSASSNTYKNSLGAAYEFETLVWVGKTMVVTLEQYEKQTYEYAGREGSASFETRSAYDASIAEAEAKRKKALTDF